MVSKKARAKQARQLAVTTEVDADAAVRRPPVRLNEAAERFAVACARLMHDDRCEDIVILDLRGVSPVCDYFVIATGTSDRQMRAVVDHIEEMARQLGEKPYGTDGYEEGVWIVADYVDVVIHLFDAGQRGYYDLDSLWGDSAHVEWAQPNQSRLL